MWTRNLIAAFWLLIVSALLFAGFAARDYFKERPAATATTQPMDPVAEAKLREAQQLEAQIKLEQMQALHREAQAKAQEPPAIPLADPVLHGNMRGAKERGNTFKRSFAVVPHDGTWSKWAKVGQCVHWSQTLPNNNGWPVKMQYVYADGQLEEFDVVCNLDGFNKLLLRDGRVVNWIRYRWNDGVTDPARKGSMFTINIERHPDMPEPDLEMPAIDPPAAAPAAPAPAVIAPPTTAPTTAPATNPTTTSPSVRGSTNDSSTIHLASGRKVLGTGSYRGKGTMTGRGSYTGKGTLVGQGSYQGPGTLQ